MDATLPHMPLRDRKGRMGEHHRIMSMSKFIKLAEDPMSVGTSLTEKTRTWAVQCGQSFLTLASLGNTQCIHDFLNKQQQRPGGGVLAISTWSDPVWNLGFAGMEAGGPGWILDVGLLQLLWTGNVCHWKCRSEIVGCDPHQVQHLPKLPQWASKKCLENTAGLSLEGEFSNANITTVCLAKGDIMWGILPLSSIMYVWPSISPMQVSIPRCFHVVFTPVLSIFSRSYFYNYDTMHLTCAVFSMWKLEQEGSLTNNDHVGFLQTLCWM